MLRWHSGRMHSPCKRDITVGSNPTRSSIYRRVKRRNAYQPHKLGWRRFDSYLGNQKRGLGRFLSVEASERLTQSAAVSFVVSLKVQ